LTEEEKRSKSAFSAWLDSRFTSQKDLDIIRDDLIAQVKDVASIGEALIMAGVIMCFSIDSFRYSVECQVCVVCQ